MKAAHAILSVSVAVFAAANVCEAFVIAVQDGGVEGPTGRDRSGARSSQPQRR